MDKGNRNCFCLKKNKKALALHIFLNLSTYSSLIKTYCKIPRDLLEISIYIQSFLAPWDFMILKSTKGFPGGSDSKESTCNVGDLGLNPELGRFPGEWNGNPLQYSCLQNSRNRGAWQAPVHGVAKSWTWLTDFHFTSRSTEFQSKPDILIKGWLIRLLLIIVYLEKQGFLDFSCDLYF